MNEKILIIGHGSTAIRHATNIVTSLPHTLKIAFLRRKKENEFKFATYFFDINDAKKWNPDIVIICTPSNMHERYIKIFSDKHIFVEKPAVISENELVSLDSASNKVFQIGFNLRFHEVFKEIDTSNVSHAEWYHSDFLPSWHPWEDYRKTYPATDGVALTLSHGLDMVYQLFGEFGIMATEKEYNLDIAGDSSFFAQLNCSGMPVSYFTKMDKEEAVCHLRLTYHHGETVTYDFNQKRIPRNESFKSEIIDFFNKVRCNDTSKNNSEKFISKLIVKACNQ